MNTQKIERVTTDPDKNYVQTGKDGKVTAFYIPDFQYSVLGKITIYRLLNDRDLKVLITSKGKTTGTGKTTLAILYCKWVNKVRNDLFDMQEEWAAKDYSFMNTWEYLEKYRNCKKGDPLLTDELEYMADRRRHQTHENVKFSQAWSMLRYRNAVTVGTAPGLMDLEKRIPEGADIWINVTYQGQANVYYLTVDDFQWIPIYKRLKMFGYRETILWDSIENDEDYQWLKNEKESLGVPGIDDMNHIDESDLKQTKQEVKNELAKNLIMEIYEKGGELTKRGSDEYFSQSDIAEISGVSQQQVSVLKQDLEKEGKIET